MEPVFDRFTDISRRLDNKKYHWYNTDETPNITRLIPNIIKTSDMEIFDTKLDRFVYEVIKIMVDLLYRR